MNHTLLLISALLLMAPAAFAQSVPRPAPAFSITMLNGQKASLSDYKGKVVLLAGLLTT